MNLSEQVSEALNHPDVRGYVLLPERIRNASLPAIQKAYWLLQDYKASLTSPRCAKEY